MFLDRSQAGRQLASQLYQFASSDPLVLGLANGGVPVAASIALALDGDLDVWVAKKLTRGNKVLGAMSEGGGLCLDERGIDAADVSIDELEALSERCTSEVRRTASLLRERRPMPDVRGRTVILVDDGIATGSTARAALEALRKRAPARLVLAVPVATQASLEEALASLCDEVVCIMPCERIRHIGNFYEDFEPVSNDEVRLLLSRGARHDAEAAAP